MTNDPSILLNVYCIGGILSVIVIIIRDIWKLFDIKVIIWTSGNLKIESNKVFDSDSVSPPSFKILVISCSFNF